MSKYNVVAVILGGGQGNRLLPLTQVRAKPAVPIAGKYRLVDIPISNCLNSGIRKIYLLTQFNSVSLHQHIQMTYRFDAFHQGFVRLLAAQQTPGRNMWFQGTADAVRQTLHYLEEEAPDYIVILSGDQLYRMDFQDVIKRHRDAKAELTIATKPVTRSEASGLGIMQVNEKRRIVNFVEKPDIGPELDPLRDPLYADERYLASMGIYVFNRKVLVKLLENDLTDFGHNIIPEAIRNHRVHSFVFEGYWKDIGTIGAFWEANLMLTDIVPEFTFYDPSAPIYTHSRFLPPSKINACDVTSCLLTEGCIISGKKIRHSIFGIRAIVGDGTIVEDSVVMGADGYEKVRPKRLPAMGIGRDCVIHKAIIDKNARIGDGAYISPEGKKDGTETNLYTVRDGIIVIPKNTVIPKGKKL